MNENMTKETIKIEVEYEIQYKKPEGREDAIKSALELVNELYGAGMNGLYSVSRGAIKQAEEKI